MTRVEVHDTVEEVKLIEKLDFQLDITDRAYRSEYDLDGEVRMVAGTTHETVENRKSPPRGVLDVFTPVLGGDESSFDRFPSTRVFVGLSHVPPTEQDDESFHKDVEVAAVEINGVPTDDTIEFEADWTAEEARTARAENKKEVHSEQYDIEGLSSERLPIVVRADLFRDAAELADEDDVKFRQRLEGLSALQIELEHQTTESDSTLRLQQFEVQLSSTFPQVKFFPQANSTYDPDSKKVRWKQKSVPAGHTAEFRILGPINELLDIDRVEARLRGEIQRRTLSGLQLAGVYDETGRQFPSRSKLETAQKVTITSDIEIDPSALSGRAQDVTRSKIRAKTTPEALYEELVALCRREGIQIKSNTKPTGAEPVAGQKGVYAITEGKEVDSDDDSEAGKIRVKKEFGDQGVVHSEMTITGRFTAVSEETRVSTFDESDEELVRADQGAMDKKGEATADVVVRSMDSELNSKLIETLESVFGGSH